MLACLNVCMINVFQSIFLGAVQGITEFLPISSSAHLVLVRWIFNWQDPGIAFDVVLHFGTLIGVVWFFFPKWIDMFKSVFSRKSDNEIKFNRKLFWMIVVATIPAGLVGFLFNDVIEGSLRSPMVVGWTMIIFGILLWLGDKYRIKNIELRIKNTTNIGWWRSMAVGFLQALALIPGVSRSGITMTAGLFSGLDRKTAAEFSFLLAVPIIFGAGLKEIPTLIGSGGLTVSLILGFLSAAIFGFLAVRFLIKHLERGSYKPFAWYRVIIGILIVRMIII
ncbi:undecaprenyl-diphosphatase UppP [bacterium]|nr:MAG: undecaprenyl-diphosphatase UppP [bacterium]